MPALRFVHAADLHLDSPFTGLKTVSEDISRRLSEATFRAYENIIDLCLDEHVDGLLVAGDLYDGADRSLRAQLKLVEGLKKLDAAGIRSFICYGNHDPLSGWEAGLKFPPGCHVFGPEVKGVPLDPADPDKAIVYGVSYSERDVRDNLALRFTDLRPNAAFSIGLLHCNVGGNLEHAAYAPCSIDDLIRTGIDYWALGHFHSRQVPSEQSPAIVYPGNPQARNPKESGPRGVYLVEVSPSGRVHLDFRATDTVRWAGAELSIEELESEQALLDEADASVEKLLGAAEGRHVVYSLHLRGRGPLHRSLKRAGFCSDLQDQLNETWAGREPFAWCARLQVSTAPAFDREERKQARDFVADLLRHVDELKADPAKLEALGEELQALYAHTRAKRYLAGVFPDEKEMLRLLAEAETECLDRLVAEEEP